MDDAIKSRMLALLPRMRRFALGLTGTRDRADDLVQATYERAIREIDKWTEGTRLDSWMFRISRNIYLNQLRSEKLRSEKSSPTEDEQEGFVDGEGHMEARHLFHKLRAAVAGLPEGQRTALILVAIEGYTYKEVSDLIGEPMGTIASRVARARETLTSHPDLRAQLCDRGISEIQEVEQ